MQSLLGFGGGLLAASICTSPLAAKIVTQFPFMGDMSYVVAGFATFAAGSFCCEAIVQSRQGNSAPLEGLARLVGGGFAACKLAVPVSRWLGLRTLMKREVNEGRRQKVLFVMDEFLALGRMDVVLQAVNVGASYGIKLWPIAQNVNGLVHLYGENWQTFVDGAGAIQVFSIGNRVSAEFLADALGHHEINMTGQSGARQFVPVRTGQEVQEETDRDWKKQIVLRSGKKALYLNRLPYDKHFNKWEYSPDPDHLHTSRFSAAWRTVRLLFLRIWREA